jgi:uncharacterized protein YqeY
MIQVQIKTDTVTAMKARDALRVETLRMLTTAFVNELVATKHKPDEQLSDEDAIAVIRREVKKRKEAAEAFKGGGRAELAEKEEQERKILEAYLPALMSEEDVRKAVEAKKSALGVTDKKDMGRLMGAVMKELGGKADGTVVKKVVDSLF